MGIYHILILFGITSFYLIYFCKQLLLKKHGIKTNRLGRGDKPKRTFFIEVGLLVATYVMALVQYISIIFLKDIYVLWDTSLVKSVGIAVCFLGVICFLLAIITMKDSWRAGVDKTQETKIITNGIYSLSRNPAFLGFDLMYIGTCMVFPSILLIVFTIVAVMLLHLQILEEEKFLPSVFGEDYIRYKKNTRRYI